jgi:predicted MFS family arabinose efflux permease
MEALKKKPGWRASFASLQHPHYRMLWWSGLFSFMGVQMQFVLRGILAWDITGSEAALGTVMLGFGLAMLIATPLGGVAADRLSKRAILLASQIVLTVSAVFIGVAALGDFVSLWMLVLASVAQGAAFGFFGPARMAITMEMVGREQLGNAISLAMLSMNGTRVFAPSLAGALAGVAVIGIGGAYLVAAFFSVICQVMLHRLPKTARRAPSGRNPLGELADGVRYVAREPRLRLLTLCSFVVIMFGFNYVSFMPALIKGEFGLGDGSVGLIMSASAVGAVLVAMPVASRADSASAGRIMVVSGFFFGGAVAALGLSPTFVVAVLTVAVAGAGTTAYQSLSNTLALSMADDNVQGRVQSLMMLSFAGFGIAAQPLGTLAERIGLRPTLVIMGAVTTAAGLVFVAGSRILDRAEARASTSDPALDLTG